MEKYHWAAVAGMPHKCSPNKFIKSSALSYFICILCVLLNKKFYNKNLIMGAQYKMNVFQIKVSDKIILALLL
jgi:hypothetical protein